MRLRWIWLPMLSAALAFSGTARTDEPLPVPAPYQRCSWNRKYCVKADPQRGTVAYEMEGSKFGPEIWKMPDWHRVAALADDGVHFVTGYDGMNLIPEKYDRRMVMLTFYRSGK